ncbi:uncharacterized protein VICG_01397 [Vittaforma corneae ATCC 50505]|uniref:Calcineurin subunit B n=1 Tax=Vittaforma corneae (strain ATCC 50505) TaxID=993615 RepID=L2GKX1_VITCO|nr:uncharacterized protein VICG_01397 [Vittaforma corneae ATCC 50505]ELA41533.1 hypothetical protein VICG_01397 [Vittaforma corneae ATCC 50505]
MTVTANRSSRQEEEIELDRKIERMGKRDIFGIPEIKNNPLSVILIKKFTKDEKLNTKEMIRTLYHFVNSKGIDEKLEFIFGIYDLDNDGLVSTKDLFEMIKILNKGILDDWKIQNIVDKTFAEIGEYKLSMSCEEFKKLVLKTTSNLKEMFGCKH